MAASHESNDEYLWDIERTALQYEIGLKQGGCDDSIESLLATHPRLPRTALLKALIETELDVLGSHADSQARYLVRFPDDASLIQSIFEAPLDDVRPPLTAGETVASYRIGRLLGKGAVGYVYLASDNLTNSPVAIKILRPDRLTARGGSYRDLFRNEAKIGGSLDHPRIVKLLGGGEHAGLPYHVFEFVDGMTLRDFRRRRPLHPLVAARITAQVADAIHYSHQRGIVHRDLKPSNIIIDRTGTPYVTDFGIALDDSQQGSGARIAGTPHYMSPEQLKGDADLVDGRSDVYSLGVILYEALAGVHPTLGHASSDRDLDEALIIKSATPLRQRIKVSPRLEHICMKALRKEPSDRFSTASDLAHALRRFVVLSQVKRAVPFVGVAAIVLTCTLLALQSVGIFQSWSSAAVALDRGPTRAESTTLTEKPSAPGLPEIQPPSLESLLANGVASLPVGEVGQAASLILAALQADPNVDNPHWVHFESNADNTLQTALIHNCAVEGLDGRILVERMSSQASASARSAMLLALGKYSLEQFPQIERERLLPDLLNAYCSDPRAIIHTSVEWLLRHWGFDDELMEANRQLFRPPSIENFEWYTALPDVTMVVCDMPAAGPATEGVKFAISTHEISTWQWDWNNATLQPAPHAAVKALPKNLESWHTCAAFCNKLSARAGLPPSQYCYEQLSGNHYRPYADAISRRGFRMPTVAEWTYAARAQTTTGRYWGRQDELLSHYANCRPHSLLRRIACGTLMPNGLGLFDVLGNVSEWMHDTPGSVEPASVAADRPICGGSAWTIPANVQVDGEYLMQATEQSERMGLRLAQSLLPVVTNNDPFGLKLRTEKQLELPAKATHVSDFGRIRLPFESTQSLSTDCPTLVAKVLRGEECQHSLLIENRVLQPLTIEQFAITGCLEATSAAEGNLRLLPGATISIPLRVKQSNAGTHTGQVAIYWSEIEGRPHKSEYNLTTCISGPAVAAIEDPLDEAASIHIDFGTVAAGTKLLQVTTLFNVGDQKLTLSEARGSGALHVLSPPSPVEVIGNRYAFFEFQVDTTQYGAHSGSMEISTGDPLAPVVQVNAKVTVADLAQIPVLGLFREGLWLLDSNHDGTADRSIPFGDKADQPLAGDFDGDGIAELAVVHINRDGKLELHIRFQRDEDEFVSIRPLDVSSG